MNNPKKDVDPYTLKSATDGFAARAKNVFDCLQNLEDKHKALEKARKDNSSENESDQGLLKDEPSQAETETIKPAFKKPLMAQRGHSRSFQSRRPFKRNRMPDFNDGPAKWKKYSLEDVDEINDSTNRQAAYSFLEERRKLREGEITEAKVDVQSTACSKGQFTFTKKAKETKQSEKVINSRKTDDSNSQIDQKLDFVEDEIDNNGDKVESSKEKQTVTIFKSRKTGKRNIRARNTKEEDEDDT